MLLGALLGRRVKKGVRRFGDHFLGKKGGGGSLIWLCEVYRCWGSLGVAFGVLGVLVQAPAKTEA